jgi:hypothetical protein
MVTAIATAITAVAAAESRIAIIKFTGNRA